MKKVFKNVFLLLVSCILISGCNYLGPPKTTSTEYNKGDVATIDKYDITLKESKASTDNNSVASTKGQYVILTFSITNKEKVSQSIVYQNAFKLLVNGETYTNQFLDSSITIAPSETKEITLIYDVPKQTNYEILFYSGVVDNNIKFKFSL